MNTETDNLLLQVAEAVAEGRPIDWNALALRTDADVLDRLHEISNLAGRFGWENDVSKFKSGENTEPTFRVWAHLQVNEELGRGSSGVVYRAWDPILQRYVALKLCNSDGANQDDLLREAQLMARVDHTGVLKIHGAAKYQGQVGFWSDLVAGDSISSRLEREGSLSAMEVVAVGLELCAALAAIHAHELVHGDVKAQNVMRRRDGHYVLVDFGSSTPTQALSQVSGTPLYLAPELLAGGPAAPADDLYSLGVLLFLMLSGRFPVEASSLLGLVECHRTGSRCYLVDLVPGVTPKLATVIERSVSADRRERFRSAGEVADALRSCLLPHQLSTSPVTAVAACTSSALPTTARSSSRRFYWIAAAPFLIAVIAILTWWPRGIGETHGFQARLIRAEGGVEYPLLDGDRVKAGDTLSLSIELQRESYVYVFNEDAAGAVFQLFPLPMAEQINPLSAAKRLRLPGRVGGRDLDWLITSPGARERFYVLVSPNAIGDLGVDATGFAQAELGRPVDRSALMAATRRVRGAGGLSERQGAGLQFDWKVGDWLAQLQDRHPGASLQTFELDNPP